MSDYSAPNPIFPDQRIEPYQGYKRFYFEVEVLDDAAAIKDTAVIKKVMIALPFITFHKKNARGEIFDLICYRHGFVSIGIRKVEMSEETFPSLKLADPSFEDPSDAATLESEVPETFFDQIKREVETALHQFQVDQERQRSQLYTELFELIQVLRK